MNASSIIGELACMLAKHHAAFEETIRIELDTSGFCTAQLSTQPNPGQMECEEGSALEPWCLPVGRSHVEREKGEIQVPTAIAYTAGNLLQVENTDDSFVVGQEKAWPPAAHTSTACLLQSGWDIADLCAVYIDKLVNREEAGPQTQASASCLFPSTCHYLEILQPGRDTADLCAADFSKLQKQKGTQLKSICFPETSLLLSPLRYWDSLVWLYGRMVWETSSIKIQNLILEVDLHYKASLFERADMG